MVFLGPFFAIAGVFTQSLQLGNASASEAPASPAT